MAGKHAERSRRRPDGGNRLSLGVRRLAQTPASGSVALPASPPPVSPPPVSLPPVALPPVSALPAVLLDEPALDDDEPDEPDAPAVLLDATSRTQAPL